MKRLSLILHPFFFALYAILGVYAQNIGSTPIARITRPLLTLLLITISLYLLLRQITGNEHRAGLWSTISLAWLFFGHPYRLLISTFALIKSPRTDFILLAIWSVVLFKLGTLKLWNKTQSLNTLTNFLNITSWIILILPLYLTASSFFHSIQQDMAVRKQVSNNQIQLESVISTKPDIYVIILDAYGRADFLNKVFHYDNSDFITFLTEKNFYIAKQSEANYPQTTLSLASLLNINYLDNLTVGMGASNNRAPLFDMIENSNIRAALEKLGYKFISVSNFDQYCIKDGEEREAALKIRFNPFEELIISTTAIDLFLQAWNFDLPVASYEGRRHHITRSLEFIKCSASIPGPKFVYVHLLAPHPPFVFNKVGEPIQPNYPYTPADGDAFPGTVEDYIEGYTNETIYLNNEMKSVLTTVLEKSQEPPIIILQGDHGPGNYFTILGIETEPCLEERYSILNAYYFPDKNYNSLYATITPVNSFRIVFSTYFGANLPILEDRNYYATFAHPYKFIDITDQASSCFIDFSQ